MPPSTPHKNRPSTRPHRCTQCLEPSALRVWCAPRRCTTWMVFPAVLGPQRPPLAGAREMRVAPQQKDAPRSSWCATCLSRNSAEKSSCRHLAHSTCREDRGPRHVRRKNLILKRWHVFYCAPSACRWRCSRSARTCRSSSALAPSIWTKNTIK